MDELLKMGLLFIEVDGTRIHISDIKEPDKLEQAQ